MKIGPAGDRQQSHTLRTTKNCTAQQREHNCRHARAHPMHENGTAQERERNSRDARAHPMHENGTAQQRERNSRDARARIRCMKIAPRRGESAVWLKHARADAHILGGVRMARRTRIWRLEACTGASCIRARASDAQKLHRAEARAHFCSKEARADARIWGACGWRAALESGG